MIRRLFERSDFNRDVMTMLTGGSVAQAIPILVSPILTRLFTPTDFGIYAIYMALAAVLLPVSTARYELPVILPTDDDDARSLMAVVCVVAFAVAAVVLGIVLAWPAEISSLVNNPGLEPWLPWLPLSVAVTGIYMALYYYGNRNRRFPLLSTTKVAQSGTTATVNLILGFSKAIKGGLIVGAIAGQVVTTLFLGSRLRKDGWPNFDRRRMIANAKRYFKFPAVKLPATLIETASSHAPTVLLSVFFGPVVVGWFALSQRVVRVPVGIVSRAVADVFRQRANEDFTTTGDARMVFRETLAKLALVSFVPFVAFLFIAPWLFEFVFGDSWRTAGEYARILTPMLWLSFIVSPVSSMFMIAEKQQWDLVLQVFLLLGSVTALTIGHSRFQSPSVALTLFTAVYCVKYLIELALSYRFATHD